MDPLKSQRNSSSTQGPAEFSNGLISDLAPLLALFGEQLTKQFMSQSMYWSDHIMFAMAPLGIIAACVGAIRVAGPTWMKAIIGRARESRGLAEVELLSSTSHDVCELWNGRQIVRVLGSAPVKQLLCFPDHLVEDEHGLYTLEEAVHKGLMIAVKDCSRLDILLNRIRKFGTGYRSEESSKFKVSLIRNCAPNISLNFSTEVSRWYLRSAAATGLVIQLGVVAFQGLTRYYPDINLQSDASSLSRAAFILTAVGSLLLCLGMILCSYAVEQCTDETVWKAKGTSGFHLFWVQKGQVVNDQLFESFAIGANGKRTFLKTSHPYISPARIEQGDFTQEEEPVSHFLESITIVGTLTALSGFILQLIGLRGLHWSATVVQVAATAVMTIIRTAVRSNIAGQPFAYPLPKGFELEWLAMQSGCGQWVHEFAENQDSESRNTAPVEPCDKSLNPWPIMSPISILERTIALSKAGGLIGNLAEVALESPTWDVPCRPVKSVRGLLYGQTLESVNTWVPSPGRSILSMRERLGKLTCWDGPASEEALCLTNAMEFIMNKVEFSEAATERIELPLYLELSLMPTPELPVYVSFLQDKWENNKWKATEAQIEALLSLWLFSTSRHAQYNETFVNGIAHMMSLVQPGPWPKAVLERHNNFRRLQGQVAGREERIRLLGPATGAARRDFGWWLAACPNKLVMVEHNKYSHVPEPSFLVACPTGAESCSAAFTESAPAQRFIGYGGRTRIIVTDCGFILYECPVDNHPFEEPNASSNYTVCSIPTEAVLSEPTNPGPDESSTSAVHLGVQSYISLNRSCAQHIFALFLLNTAFSSAQIGGQTVLDDRLASSVNGTYNLQLHNATLDELAAGVAETGLCTKDEAYLAIVPAFSFYNKLPKADCVVEWASNKARLHESIGHWNDAAQIYLWLFSTCNLKSFNLEEDETAAEATTLLMETAVKATALLIEFTRSLTLVVALWENQHRKGPTIRDLTDLVHKLIFKLQEEAAISELTQKLLTLSSMCGKLPAWGTLDLGLRLGPQTRLVEHREQDTIDNANWPKAFNYTSLHQAALDKAGWRIPMLLSTTDTTIHAADIFGRVALHYAMANDSDAARILLSLGANPRATDIGDWTPLHYAAWYGNEKAVRLLIPGGADIDAKGKEGMTPLHCAAARNHAKIAEFLLESGANMEAHDNGRRTPLHWAACAGATTIVEHLVDKGACHMTREEYGRTPLHLAAMTGSQVVKALLQASKSTTSRTKEIGVQDRDGCTPLHLAVQAGREDVAELLFDHGADIGAKDAGGNTALHMATKSEKKELFTLLMLKDDTYLNARNNDFVSPLQLILWFAKEELIPLVTERGRKDRNKSLVEKIALLEVLINGKHDEKRSREFQAYAHIRVGQDINHASGLTAFHRAVVNGAEDLVEALLEDETMLVELNGMGFTAMHYAAWRGHTELANFLISKGANPDLPGNADGSTPLHFAFGNGETGLLKLLLDNGANVSHKNHYGVSTLHFAAWAGNLEAVKVLLEKMGNHNCLTLSGEGLVHYSATSGNVDLIRFVLGLGLDIESQTKFGNTPLHMAAMAGKTEATGFLLSQGANMHAAGYLGITALHLAVMGGNVEVIALLLDAGAEINHMDDDGNTALHFAAAHATGEAVAGYLLFRGAKVDQTDKLGRRALDFAVMNKHTEVVRLLSGGVKK